MANYLFISDAAKEVKVESHVLRYWEEELHLPIRRNELGHRYYTEEDVERFKQIKGMKERGLQLKAIKMILKDGKLDVLPPMPTMREETAQDGGRTESGVAEQTEDLAIDIVPYHTMGEKKYESLGMKYKLKGVPAMDKTKLLDKKKAIIDGIKKRRS